MTFLFTRTENGMLLTNAVNLRTEESPVTSCNEKCEIAVAMEESLLLCLRGGTWASYLWFHPEWITTYELRCEMLSLLPFSICFHHRLGPGTSVFFFTTSDWSFLPFTNKHCFLRTLHSRFVCRGTSVRAVFISCGLHDQSHPSSASPCRCNNVRTLHIVVDSKCWFVVPNVKKKYYDSNYWQVGYSLPKYYCAPGRLRDTCW